MPNAAFAAKLSIFVEDILAAAKKWPPLTIDIRSEEQCVTSYNVFFGYFKPASNLLNDFIITRSDTFFSLAR